jgi:hypothetical protein
MLYECVIVGGDDAENVLLFDLFELWVIIEEIKVSAVYFVNELVEEMMSNGNLIKKLCFLVLECKISNDGYFFWAKEGHD